MDLDCFLSITGNWTCSPAEDVTPAALSTTYIQGSKSLQLGRNMSCLGKKWKAEIPVNNLLQTFSAYSSSLLWLISHICKRTNGNITALSTKASHLSDNYNISTSDSSRTIKHRRTEVKPQIRSQLHGNCCAHHRNWCGLIFMSCGLIRTGTKQSPCQKEPVLLRRWSRRWLMTALQLSQECQCSVRSVLKKGFQMLLPAAFSSHTEELLEWPNLLQRPLEKALDSHCCFPKKG